MAWISINTRFVLQILFLYYRICNTNVVFIDIQAIKEFQYMSGAQEAT